MRRVVAFAGCALTAGCYSYQPLEQPAPVPGDVVQLQLAPEGTAEVAKRLGPNVIELEARVRDVTSDTLRLAMRMGRTLDRLEFPANGDTISLAQSAIVSMARRRLAIGQTALAAGAFVGGTLGIVAAAGGFDGSTGTGAGPGGVVNPR